MALQESEQGEPLPIDYYIPASILESNLDAIIPTVTDAKLKGILKGLRANNNEHLDGPANDYRGMQFGQVLGWHNEFWDPIAELGQAARVHGTDGPFADEAEAVEDWDGDLDKGCEELNIMEFMLTYPAFLLEWTRRIEYGGMRYPKVSSFLLS